MPAYVIEDPLSVFCTFPNAKTFLARLHGLPNPQLARELADALAADIHPLGGLGTPISARTRKVALRHLVTTLHGYGFTGGAAELTRPLMVRYWLSVKREREDSTRKVLQAYDRITGSLQHDLRAQLAGRPVNGPIKTHPCSPYSEGEWARLTQACRADAGRWWTEHQEAMALARTGADPISAGLSRENLAWLLAHHGPMLRSQLWAYLDRPRTFELDQLGFDQLREAMYPPRVVATVHRILFGIYTGIVPDGVSSLGLDDIDWAGDTEVLLRYVKGRTAPESLHLPRRATQLLERWLVVSSPMRRFAATEPRSALWLWSMKQRVGGSVIATMPMSNYNNPAQDWAANNGLHDDHGRPLSIDSRRIRVNRPGMSGDLRV